MKDTNEIEKLQAVVKFVQSLTYRTDVRSRNNFEYFRDGIETLVDTVGDCEDTSYLLAALLEREPFDYSTGMAFPPSHALPIVKQSDLPYTRDDFYTIDVNGVQYVPIESTELAPIGYTQYKNTLAVYTNGELRNINPGAITRIFE